MRPPRQTAVPIGTSVNRVPLSASRLRSQKLKEASRSLELLVQSTYYLVISKVPTHSKMPGITVPMRRRRLDDSDGEDDGASEGATPASQTSSSNKRARLDVDPNDEDDASQVSAGPVRTNGDLSNGVSQPESRGKSVD